MRIEAVCDGEDSSAMFVLNNLAKHSKHQWKIVQFNPTLDCDVVYLHIGAMIHRSRPDILKMIEERRDVKWVAGLRGNLNYIRFMYYDEQGNYVPINYVRMLDAISCSNQFYLDEMRKFGLKAYHCPSGVDMNLFKPTTFPKEFTVGFVGSRDHNEKRYNLFQQLPFKQELSDYPVWILYKDMPQFYERISVLVCCSWSEGSPVPPKEAAACGKPTVVFRVGDLEEWLPQDCFVDDYEGLVNKLNDLKNNDSLLHDLGNSAYNNVKKYDYSILIKSYDKMFDDLLTNIS